MILWPGGMEVVLVMVSQKTSQRLKQEIENKRRKAAESLGKGAAKKAAQSKIKDAVTKSSDRVEEDLHKTRYLEGLGLTS